MFTLVGRGGRVDSVRLIADTPALVNAKIYIETYGCQMNDYESDRTYRRFEEGWGYERTEDPSQADVILYNTCSVRDKADQKAFSSIGSLREIKEERPDLVIAVGGCVAQSAGEDLLARFSHVDLVFGTHQWAKLPELIEEVRTERKRALKIDFQGWQNYDFLPYKATRQAHPVAELVTVQNGCDKFCTFCVVPFTRGRQVSRPAEEIEAEVRSLVEVGVREIMLLGQNVNAYGNDRSGSHSFVELLRLLGRVDGLERLRFMTSHPAELTREMVDEMAEQPKICEHLHLPLQSGSDRILAKMNRGHTLKQYRDIIGYALDKISNLSVTTDIIVGFPSETDEEFDQTLAAMSEFQFEDSYSFAFSPRPHTKAEAWGSEFVPSEVAQKRLVRLQELQRTIKERKSRAYYGKIVQVLVEREARRGGGMLAGRTRTNRTVNFSGPMSWAGKLLDVRITEVLPNSMRGETVAA